MLSPLLVFVVVFAKGIFFHACLYAYIYLHMYMYVCISHLLNAQKFSTNFCRWCFFVCLVPSFSLGAPNKWARTQASKLAYTDTHTLAYIILNCHSAHWSAAVRRLPSSAHRLSLKDIYAATKIIVSLHLTIISKSCITEILKTLFLWRFLSSHRTPLLPKRRCLLASLLFVAFFARHSTAEPFMPSPPSPPPPRNTPVPKILCAACA